MDYAERKLKELNEESEPVRPTDVEALEESVGILSCVKEWLKDPDTLVIFEDEL